MRPEDVRPEDAPGLLGTVNPQYVQRVSDYLEGRWLGPEGREDSLEYWAGPMLPPEHDEYIAMRSALKKAIAADNLPRTCLETYLDAVTGLEDWRLVPEGTDAPDEPSEDEQAFTAYLDRVGFSGLMYRLGLTLAAHGRTVARPVLSRRARDEEGNVIPAADLQEALSRIHWQAPGWPRASRMVSVMDAGVLLDDDLEPYSVVHYTVERDRRTVRGLEVSWVDEEGTTQVRVIEEGQTQIEPVPLDLGGRLMLVESHLPRPFVTRSMLGAMDQYVVASTMLARNTHYAGYVEKYAIGIQPPGFWKNPDGSLSPTPTGPESVWEPRPLRSGPAHMNFFQPASTIETVTDAMGTRETERPTPASVGRWEPVSPAAIEASIDHWRRAIRAEARQSFLELADNADASGRSREVASGDYLAAAQKLADAESRLVRDILELTCHLAALQLPDADAARLRSYRATVQARVKAFPPGAAERAANLQEWQAGLISHETAVTRAGIDDPDAELPRAQAEQAARQQQALEMMQARSPVPTEEVRE